MKELEIFFISIITLLIVYAIGILFINLKYGSKKQEKQRDMKHLCGTAIKKPTEINFFKWEKWSATNVKELKAWIESFGNKFEDVIDSKSQGKFRVRTLEGTSYDLPDGYIIIRGVEGEYYPCEPSIFNKTYEIC